MYYYISCVMYASFDIYHFPPFRWFWVFFASQNWLISGKLKPKEIRPDVADMVSQPPYVWIKSRILIIGWFNFPADPICVSHLIPSKHLCYYETQCKVMPGRIMMSNYICDLWFVFLVAVKHPYAFVISTVYIDSVVLFNFSKCLTRCRSWCSSVPTSRT